MSRTLTAILVVLLAVSVAAAWEPDARWLTIHEDESGNVLRLEIGEWLDGVDCWPRFDDCGADLVSSCRKAGGTGVKSFSLTRRTNAVTGETEDVCSGECANTPESTTVHKYCTRIKPRIPTPHDPVTGGGIEDGPDPMLGGCGGALCPN
jgi:hypothetical protein